jgi:hypothetical protein
MPIRRGTVPCLYVRGCRRGFQPAPTKSPQQNEHLCHSERSEESQILAFNYSRVQHDITGNLKMLLVKTEGFQT